MVNVPTPDVKISLTPRTSEFYELFSRAGENALVVARLVERRFREHPNSGVTQDEIKEVILQCAIYAGVPAANHAIKIIKQTYAEMAKKPRKKSK